MLTGHARACLAMVADVQEGAVDRPDLDGRVLDTYPATRVGGRAVPEATLESPVVVAVVEDRLVEAGDDLDAGASHDEIRCRGLTGVRELSASGAAACERDEQYAMK